MASDTVESVLVAAASIHFDEIFGQNLLSKNWVLLRLLFEGGFYLRAASNTDDTVCTNFPIKTVEINWYWY